MLFFRIGKDPFNRLFPFLIDFFDLVVVSQVFCNVQIVLPNMPLDHLLLVFTLRTLVNYRACGTDSRRGSVLAIPFLRCRTIGKDLALRAHVTIEMLIIDILMFLEKTLFRHRPFIRKYR